MVTIKQIAQTLGVSSVTVSRVLSHDPKLSVSKETREAVLLTAEKLGYKKKAINPKIENVALLYWYVNGEELDNIFHESILREVKKQAADCNVSLIEYRKNDGIHMVKRDITAFIAIGWLDMKEVDYLKKLTHNGIFINTRPDESVFDTVQANQGSMIMQIVDYFVNKGHKDIGFLGAPDYDMITKKPLMDEREWSFRQTMSFYGLLKEEHIFIADAFTVKEGYRVSMDAIGKWKDKLPTAMCVANDALAIGALQAFNEVKWEIPGRISFFSINDIGIAKYVSPPLTTFNIDISLLCSSALDLLKERVFSGRTVTKSVYINGRAVFRKSC